MCDLLDEPMPVSARKNSGEGLGLQLGKYFIIIPLASGNVGDISCIDIRLNFHYLWE